MGILTVNLGGRVIRLSFSGTPLLPEVLDAAGLRTEFPCGRRGACGRCEAPVRGHFSCPEEARRGPERALICQVRLTGDAEVELREPEETRVLTVPESAGLVREQAASGKDGVIAVADVGTTTVAAAFYDEQTGVCLGQRGGDNPQQSLAADIMGRISAAAEGKGPLLTRQIRSCLWQLAEEGGFASRIRRWIITGNTTMLTLLAGEDPAPLGQAPFQARRLFDGEIDLDGCPAYLPPCFHAFIGADVLCALLYTGLAEGRGTALLCDVGTNGEMILWRNGEGYAASVAAGPALEGVGIRQGCRGIPGAIEQVTLWGGALMAKTIGNGKATGLCGSGVVDAVACGLETGLISPEGLMEEPMPLRDGICLYPEDVRQVQLVKAALAAGLEELLRTAGSAPEEIRSLVLCGGFGSRMNPVSAARIGLIPAALLGVTRAEGNGALAGASMLWEEANREKLRGLVRRLQHVPLGGQESFQRAYLRHMAF